MDSPADKSVALIEAVVRAHDSEWEERRPELQKYKHLYAQKFWHGIKDPGANGVWVETGDGPAHVESYLAALFSRAPAVELKLERGPEPLSSTPIERFINPWLARHRPVFEQATRLAILYPAGFLRVGPSPGLGRRDASLVEVRAVAPWDVLLDRAAPDWEHQRWVGHRYTLPLGLVLSKFKTAKKDWAPCAIEEFFEAPSNEPLVDQDELPDELKLVTLIEFYDMIRGKLMFWSRDYKGGEKVVAETVIPLRRPGTEVPVHPIVPLYFAYEPDKPLSGISTISRIYDQLHEKNLMRTVTASGVRRDARAWLARKDAFAEEELTKLTSGEDGVVVAVLPTEKRSLGDLIAPIPHAPLSGNFDKYTASIESDLDKGSVLAAFTRGEASRATATEIGVLAEYSSSAIGRMARERDAAIEQVAVLFLAHLVVGADPSQPIALMQTEGGAVAIEKSDLDREWVVTALDQAGTPVSRAVAQQRFMSLVPVLQSLGVSPQAIMAALVRFELLPPEFASPDALQPPAPPGAAPPGQVPPEGAPGAPSALPPEGGDAVIREALHVPDTSGVGPGGPIGGI